MKRTTADDAETLRRLRALVERHGNPTAASKALGLRPAEAGDLLAGRRRVSARTRERIDLAHEAQLKAQRCRVCGRPGGPEGLCGRAKCRKTRRARPERPERRVPVLEPTRSLRASTVRPTAIAHTHGRAGADWLGVGAFAEPEEVDVSRVVIRVGRVL